MKSIQELRKDIRITSKSVFRSTVSPKNSLVTQKIRPFPQHFNFT